MSYENSDEELIASVASDVKAHFEKTKKEIEAKRNPKNPYLFLPKEELRKRVEEYNWKMREARKPLPKSNYEHQLLKAVKAQPTKKKVGKGVQQLGDTSRPLSLLIVADQYGSNMSVVQTKSGEPTLSEMNSIENYFIESGLPYSTSENIAAGQEFPRAKVVDEKRRNFTPGKSLMNPKHLHVLGTQMFAINSWCMEASKGGVDWISVQI